VSTGFANIAATDFSAESDTRAEDDSTVSSDFQSTTVTADSGAGELLSLGLPFYWPDAFEA